MSPFQLKSPDESQENIYLSALRAVLVAISADDGYCQVVLKKIVVTADHFVFLHLQGMNFLAAKLILFENDEKAAFIVMSYILNQRHMKHLYDARNPFLFDYMNIFQKRLRRHNGRVYKHLKQIDYPPAMYSLEWFTTCFIVWCPGILSSCVLDLLISGLE